MAVSILSRTISSLLDKKLVLSNSQWAATLAIGTDWTTLRIGMRIAFTDTGDNLASTPLLRVGLLAAPAEGLAGGVLGNATSHYVGVQQIIASPTRTAVPTVHYAMTLRVNCKRIGSTNTLGASGIIGLWSAVPDTVRTAFILEITKGAPNFTLDEVAVTGTAGLVDVPYAGLVSVMENTAIGGANLVAALNAVIGGAGTRYASIAGTVAVSEATNGNLTALHVGWNQTGALPEISEILFAKMA